MAVHYYDDSTINIVVAVTITIAVQGLKLIQKTRRSSSPPSPRTSSLTGRKVFRTYDNSLNDDDEDDDSDEMLEFERKIT